MECFVALLPTFSLDTDVVCISLRPILNELFWVSSFIVAAGQHVIAWYREVSNSSRRLEEDVVVEARPAVGGAVREVQMSLRAHGCSARTKSV